jgi:hypothetical protein
MAILIHRRSTIAPSRKAMNQYNYTPYQFGARSHACIRLPDIQSQQIFSVFTAFFRVLRGLIVALFVLFAIPSLYAR